MQKNKHEKLKSNCHAELVSASRGRSMLEMLGVLAVIGVLSIGGLAGYSKAMTYHRANTILSDAQLAYAWMTGIEEIEEGEHKPSFIPQSGKEILVFRSASGDDFVKIVGIDESICERLLNMQSDKLHIYEGNSKMIVCSETSTMTFGFNQYAPDGSVVGGTSTGGDNTGDNTGGDNTGDDTTTPNCDAGETPLNGKCCPNEKVCGSGTNQVCCDQGTCNDEGKCCYEDTCCEEGEYAVFDEGVWSVVCCKAGYVVVNDGYCCPADKTIAGYDGICCDESSYGNYDFRCCTADEIVLKDVDGHTHCCPSNSSGPYYSNSDGCCSAEQSVITAPDMSDAYCCPKGSTGYAIDEGRCCTADEKEDSGFCCPKDSSGYAYSEARCCSSDEKLTDNGYCCSKDSTGYGDRCCTADEKVIKIAPRKLEADDCNVISQLCQLF